MRQEQASPSARPRKNVSDANRIYLFAYTLEMKYSALGCVQELAGHRFSQAKNGKEWKTLRCGASPSAAHSHHEKGTIQKGIFIFLLRCQLGGAKYEKDIDCRRDGRQRRSQIKRFAICIILAPRRSALFGITLSCNGANSDGCQGGEEFIGPGRSRIDLSSFLSLSRRVYIFLVRLSEEWGPQHVLIKYLYSAGSPLTSPKDASAAFFAVTFSTQQVIGYTHTHTRCIPNSIWPRGAILKETLPAPAEGVRYWINRWFE
jgi:hypothetical protein